MKLPLRSARLALASLLITACNGRTDYANPGAPPPASARTRTIGDSRLTVWRRAIAAIGKTGTIIESMDEGAGVVAVSVGGDPEQFLDCGHITSIVEDPRGTRTYAFPAARAAQRYERASGLGQIVTVERRMSFSARLNIVFEAYGPQQTTITVSGTYLVQRLRLARDGSDPGATDSTRFTSDTTGSFPNLDGRTISCVSTGKLEQDMLNAAR